MVIDIALGIVVAYFLIFFVGPLILSLLGGILEEIIIPMFEGIGKIISTLYKYCCSAVTWFRNLRWYYKWGALIIFAVICFLCDFIMGLLLTYVYFGVLCIDLWYKLCAKFEQKQKRKLKHGH